MSAGLLVSLLSGALAGSLANWAADTLPHCRPSPTVEACGGKPAARRARPILLALATAASFAITYLLAPAAPPAARAATCLYALLLLTVLVIDLEHRRVLNIITYPAAPHVLLLSLAPGLPGPTSALVGGAAGLALFLALALIGRGKLGMGDVKLAALIGLMAGYPAVWTALTLGVILGGAAALLLLVTRRADRRSTIAYAPYLAAGALLALWQNLL